MELNVHGDEWVASGGSDFAPPHPPTHFAIYAHFPLYVYHVDQLKQFGRKLHQFQLVAAAAAQQREIILL